MFCGLNLDVVDVASLKNQCKAAPATLKRPLPRPLPRPLTEVHEAKRLPGPTWANPTEEQKIKRRFLLADLAETRRGFPILL